MLVRPCSSELANAAADDQHQHQEFKANKCNSIALTVQQYGENGETLHAGKLQWKSKFKFKFKCRWWRHFWVLTEDCSRFSLPQHKTLGCRLFGDVSVVQLDFLTRKYVISSFKCIKICVCIPLSVDVHSDPYRSPCQVQDQLLCHFHCMVASGHSYFRSVLSLLLTALHAWCVGIVWWPENVRWRFHKIRRRSRRPRYVDVAMHLSN